MNRLRLSLPAVALATALAAQAAPPQAQVQPQPLGCLIEPHSVSDVGSPVVGVIETVHVERGDRVRAGQPLATLRADVERVSVTVAQGRALGQGELRAAEANADLARQKLVRAQDLANQQFISSQALEQARAEAMVADNRLVQAREQREIYVREHELARAQLGLRTIRSPSNGVVADRYLSPGERVEEKPMFRIAAIDPLRVEVVLPASLFAVVAKGATMRITPEFPNARPRLAQVALVDRLVEGASNTFRVRLMLPNADGALPAGLRCKAELASGDLLPVGRAASLQPPSRQPDADLDLRMTPRLRVVPRL
jgi:RND family efflux transporter MFP subunit